MATIILGDIVKNIKEVLNPKTCGLDKFVGLEHYDAGEPMITRYGSPENLDTNVKHFCKGDILVARRNVYLKRAGYVDFEGVTSGDSIVLRVTDDKYKRILPFILNTDDFWDYAEQNADGTMSKRLSPDDLLDYEFEEPENIEVLAEKLWAAYRVKESYRQLLATTDDMLKAKFQKMFGDKDCLVPLESVCETFKDGDWIESKDQSESGIRLIQTGNVGYGVFKDKDDKSKYVSAETFRRLNCTEIFAGDILISRLPDPIGRACILPEGLGRTITAVDCTIIRLKECMLPTVFIANTLSDNYALQINSFVLGTTRMRISRNNLATIKILCPAIEEQKKFDAIFNQAEATKASLRESIASIDRVIRSLINQ